MKTLNSKWTLEDGATPDLKPITNKGLLDFYDDYWKRDGFQYTVWLRDGTPEGIISDANQQNWMFDEYTPDFDIDGVEFYCVDDGSIFFRCDPAMSPDEVLDAMIKITKNSGYLQDALNWSEYDDDDEDDDYEEEPEDEEDE